jgi:hypothetical protein
LPSAGSCVKQTSLRGLRFVGRRHQPCAPRTSRNLGKTIQWAAAYASLPSLALSLSLVARACPTPKSPRELPLAGEHDNGFVPSFAYFLIYSFPWVGCNVGPRSGLGPQHSLIFLISTPPFCCCQRGTSSSNFWGPARNRPFCQCKCRRTISLSLSLSGDLLIK